MMMFVGGVTQADVSAVQGQSVRTGQARQVHHARGHRRRRRLPLQVPQLALDGVRKGRPGDAQADVHSPGLAADRRTVDEQGHFVPQTQADQQHLRQARICEYMRYDMIRYVTIRYDTSYFNVRSTADR